MVYRRDIYSDMEPYVKGVCVHEMSDFVFFDGMCVHGLQYT